MIKLLISGFEPFGGEQVNPSYEVIKRLDKDKLPCELVTIELPVLFSEAADILIHKIHEVKPDIILMIGQAGGRKKLSVERVALNLNDSDQPDNRGFTPQDEPIIPSGPIAYYSTLPIKKIVHTLKAHYIPVGISNSAGTYVCNNIFYRIMHELNNHPELTTKAGFIHVPYERRQTRFKTHLFSLEIDTLTDAIKHIIETLCLD